MNGHVRKRGNKYAIVLYLGRDENGKKKQKWISGFATKKEAQRALVENLHDIHNGVTVNVSNDTIGDYMVEWLAYKEPRVRPSTHRSYHWLVHDHLIPHIGRLKLAELKPQHLDKLYTKLLKQDHPLSARSVHHLHRIIHQALKQAVKWNLIGRNVAVLVDPPTPERLEMKVWNADQVLHFLSVSKEDRYHEVFFLALATGMRKGEILALRWWDIDFDNDRLHVPRALQWHKGQPIFVEPKTSKSRRTVTLPETLTKVLRQYKAKQNEEKLHLGSLYKDQGLIFTAQDGGPVNPRVVDAHWYACLQASSLPKIRFHDMRHTHATLLLQQGVHPKIVSERLGHSDVAITLNLYTHVLPGMQEQTAKDFDEAVFGTMHFN